MSLYRFVTLRPGDTVLTGTPPGVGCFRKPPLYLKVCILYVAASILKFYCQMIAVNALVVVLQKGDVVECEIDEIGTIRNEIQ